MEIEVKDKRALNLLKSYSKGYITQDELNKKLIKLVNKITSEKDRLQAKLDHIFYLEYNR